MAYSSIMGADTAPEEPKGRSAGVLGPSNNSDSGSDTIGTDEAHEESTDASGTGERGAVAGPDTEVGADILPDHVVNLSEDDGFPEAEDDRFPEAEGDSLPAVDPDDMEMTDLDDDDPAPADRAPADRQR